MATVFLDQWPFWREAELLRLAAELGSPEGQYWYVWHVSKGPCEQLMWLGRAARSGHQGALCMFRAEMGDLAAQTDNQAEVSQRLIVVGKRLSTRRLINREWDLDVRAAQRALRVSQAARRLGVVRRRAHHGKQVWQSRVSPMSTSHDAMRHDPSMHGSLAQRQIRR